MKERPLFLLPKHQSGSAAIQAIKLSAKTQTARMFLVDKLISLTMVYEETPSIVLESSNEKGIANELALRVRNYLCGIVGQGTPITYQALAKVLKLAPPNTIHQLTVALERLIEEDAAADRPLIAALVISKARDGLPALGFFECAWRVGRLGDDPFGPTVPAFYAAEHEKAVEFWGVFIHDAEPEV